MTASLFVLIPLLSMGCGTDPSGSASETSSAPEAAASADPNGGSVLEVMDGGGYTYLLLATSEGEKWAAVPSASVSVGDTAHIEGAMVMTDFASPSLGRTFDAILFGNLGASSAAPSERPSVAASPAEPAAKGQDMGARTVAAIFAEQAALEGGTVTVTGTVTKSTPEILGKNWIHVSDGSGSKDSGTDDLTVTTADLAQVGDAVTVTGTVARDVDLGMGYFFAVLVEDASVSPAP